MRFSRNNYSRLKLIILLIILLAFDVIIGKPLAKDKGYNWQVIPKIGFSKAYISGDDNFPRGEQIINSLGGRAGYRFGKFSLNLSIGWRRTISQKIIDEVMYREFNGIRSGLGFDFDTNFRALEIGSGIYLYGCLDKFEYVEQYCFYLSPENRFFVRYFINSHIAIENNLSFVWNKRIPADYFTIGYAIALYYKF